MLTLSKPSGRNDLALHRLEKSDDPLCVTTGTDRPIRQFVYVCLCAPLLLHSKRHRYRKLLINASSSQFTHRGRNHGDSTPTPPSCLEVVFPSYLTTTQIGSDFQLYYTGKLNLGAFTLCTSSTYRCRAEVYLASTDSTVPISYGELFHTTSKSGHT